MYKITLEQKLKQSKWRERKMANTQNANGLMITFKISSKVLGEIGESGVESEIEKISTTKNIDSIAVIFYDKTVYVPVGFNDKIYSAERIEEMVKDVEETAEIYVSKGIILDLKTFRGSYHVEPGNDDEEEN